ncbi:PD-(D/E)XK nuclease family protein [Candidatus Legionella polyplacis]|uniref:PD-(D/E)XK nuclease family protein n=1 Tax=Candidatus Legionella polyplacis TaxID=2005262 RepID=UPI0013142A24|nr:PD-(D/E)XK nuclease family protein [Candidatus Legionella polyplacis]
MKKSAIVIAPNFIIKEELLLEYFYKKAKQKIAIKKPNCFSYSEFLRYVFKSIINQYPQYKHPHILENFQIRFLWRQILSKKKINENTLLSIEKGWKQCNIWNINYKHPNFLLTKKTKEFHSWISQLKKKLFKLNSISETEIANYILNWKYKLNSKIIIWLYFDYYTCQQKKLQKSMIEQQYIIKYFDIVTNNDSFSKISKSHIFLCKNLNEKEENQKILQWVKKQSQQNNNIAIIIPELKKQSKNIKRNLQQNFIKKFKIFSENLLENYPIISHALTWINIDKKKITNEEYYLLLQSPYLIASKSEMLSRIELMKNNFFFEEKKNNYDIFCKKISKKSPKLSHALKKITTYPQKTSPKQWILIFKKRLKNLGFPGEYPLNKINYKCYQYLLLILDKLRYYTLLTSSMNKHQAITALKDLIEFNSLLLNKDTNNIKILNPLKTSGTFMKEIWIKNMNTQYNYKIFNLSSFIPNNLKKKIIFYNYKNSLKIIKKNIIRLQKNKSNIVISYSKYNNNGQLQIANSIIQNLKNIYPISLSINKQKNNKLINFFEDYQISFKKNNILKNGINVLKNFVECPFKALSLYHLNIKKQFYQSSEEIINKEKGIFLHKTMEILWKHLKNQYNLLKFNKKTIKYLINLSIKNSINLLQKKFLFLSNPLTKKNEITRLKQIINLSLKWEKKREPFIIKHLENKHLIHINNINFHIRTDRIDEDKNKKLWIIDYKSNLPKNFLQKNTNNIINNLQLSLFTLLKNNINIIMFQKLKTNFFSYKGISFNENLPNYCNNLIIKNNLHHYQKKCYNQIVDILNNFNKGHYPPNPYTPSICNKCKYKILCRKNI